MNETEQPPMVPKTGIKSITRNGESVEITLEENGQLITYRVHSSSAELFFQRKGLLPIGQDE